MQKDSSPLISILILSYNTCELTLNCLRSIYKTTSPSLSFEVCVLDNNSKDKSYSAIKKEFPQVRLFKSKINLGFSKGNNMLAKKTKGKYLLFLNSDIEALDKSIETLLNHYCIREKDIGFMGAKLLNKDMTAQPSCGPFYSLPVVAGALFLKGDYWGLTRKSPDIYKEIDWVSGACLITTKQRFLDLGGFDETIFMYMEEIDLLYRARNTGLPTAFCPHSRFIHFGSASSQGKKEPIINVYKGFLYFYKKHESGYNLFLLKRMLQLKAVIGLLIGRLFNNNYLKTTYERAVKIVQ